MDHHNSRIEELSSDSEEEEMKRGIDSMNLNTQSAVSDKEDDDFEDSRDNLDDFDLVNAEAAARQAAANPENEVPLNERPAIDVQAKKEEPLEAEILPPDEMERKLKEADEFKNAGNTFYTDQKYEQAIEKYTEAYLAAPKNHQVCAIYLSNRAACHVANGSWKQVIEDTSLALRLQPDYVKAIARRAQAYEQLNQLQEALDDLKRLVELDPQFKKISEPRMKKMEAELEIKRKKEQEEMMNQLKDMGNKFLGWFGLSLDNFKAEKDESGGYKINFSQK